MLLRLLILFLTLSASSAEQRRSLEQEQCDLDNPGQRHLFSWVDYAVLAVMLAVSCLIGTFYSCFAKKQETSEDFLLGGSNMGTFPMAMSLAASFVTAIELLGNPAEMYSQVINYFIFTKIISIYYVGKIINVIYFFNFNLLGYTILDDMCCIYFCGPNNVSALFTSFYETQTDVQL